MAHGSEHSAGVMVLKKQFGGSVLQSYTDLKCHFMLLLTSINTFSVLVINIYGYNTSRENDLLFEEIGEKKLLYLKTIPDALVCIG